MELDRGGERKRGRTDYPDRKLKPFIPDFIPAVGEVDGFIKVPRPDGKEVRAEKPFPDFENAIGNLRSRFRLNHLISLVEVGAQPVFRSLLYSWWVTVLIWLRKISSI